jgi:hypothetical protein
MMNIDQRVWSVITRDQSAQAASRGGESDRPGPPIFGATALEAGIDCQLSIRWQEAQYSFTQHPS